MAIVNTHPLKKGYNHFNLGIGLQFRLFNIWASATTILSNLSLYYKLKEEAR